MLTLKETPTDMKHFLLLFLISTVTSCVQVAFEDPQPESLKSLKAIPSGFQGKFELSIMGEMAKVEIGKNSITSDDETGYISDSVVVKFESDMLYINKRINEGDRTFWEFYVLENKGCGIFKGTMLIGADDAAITSIQENYETELVELAENGEDKKYLIIKPSKKELDELLKSDLTYSVYMEKNDK